MILRRSARWLDDRLGAASVARTSLAKVFPDHWSFMLGEIALYCFVTLVLTGVFLTFFFEPGTNDVVYHGAYAPLDGARVSAAYASSVRLSFDVRTGLLMRQVHHWAALVFVAAIVVHLCRIFFTGAFRRPRELNWLIGVSMLALSLFNGFSGYSLPDDLLSGVGLRIAYSITLSIPVVGSWLAFLVFGGEFPADQIIHRLFVVHILLVPGLLVGLLAAHIGILVRQKHSQFPGPGRTEHNVVGSKLWPTYATRSTALFCAILAVLLALGGFAQINPIWLYGPFEPSQVSSPAQPDWYIGWVEGALRMYPPWEFRVFGRLVPNPFVPAVLVPGVTFLALYLWPFLEQWLTRDRDAHQLLDRPRDHPVRCAAGAGTLAFYGLLLATASNDVVARLTRVPVASLTWAGQVILLVGPPVAAAATYVVVRALRDSGAEGVLQVSFGQLVAAVRATVHRRRPGRAARGRGRRRQPATIAGGSEDR
jgi:ubiquinol-cytochrome c reductase cytochrome b subunit